MRYDDGAPEILLDWFRHAATRVPDFEVWDLSCQIQDFFDPYSGPYLPHDWPVSKYSILALNRELRERDEWRTAFETAYEAPTRSSIRALACCAAETIERETYPMLWKYLQAHPENSWIWYLIGSDIDTARLPAYLDLARATLEAEPTGRTPRGFSEHSTPLERVHYEVLCLLERFRGSGPDLVEAGLRSSDFGVRRRACDILRFYSSPATFPDTTVTALSAASSIEPNEYLRADLERLAREGRPPAPITPPGPPGPPGPPRQSRRRKDGAA